MNYELIGTLTALVVAFSGFVVWRDKKIEKKTTQENKLDTISNNLTEVRDDVKQLGGLKEEVKSLCGKVEYAQQTANKAHSRLDQHLEAGG